MKEALSLAEAGFSVAHIAPDDEAGRFQDSGVEIITYRKGQGLVGRLARLPRLYRLAKALDAEYYHCNEVDSWLVGVALKLRYGKALIFDAHEEYPWTFAERRFPSPVRPVVAAMVGWLLGRLAAVSDRVVLAKRSLRDDYQAARDRLVLVQNFTPLEQTLDVPVREEPRMKEDGSLLLVHLGLIGRARGWEPMLEAVALSGSHTYLRIIGKFDDDSQADFEETVDRLGLRERVGFENWLPFEKAFQRLLQADVGLVLFQEGVRNHALALPHKLFDYMAAGLAVIVPRFAQEVAEIVSEARCGVVLDSPDASTLAEALRSLGESPEVRIEMGSRGRRAIRDLYNWESEAEKLIEMYRGLERERDS